MAPKQNSVRAAVIVGNGDTGVVTGRSRIRGRVSAESGRVDGHDGPPEAGSARPIRSTDTLGDAGENELRVPRPDWFAVATNGSRGTEPKRTLPWLSVVP